MKAFIFAAGKGERMGELTQHTPKPLLQVAGKPLLQHHIERLVAAGFKELVINVAYLQQQIIDFIEDGSQFGCQIQISTESTPLETAGGLVHALALLGNKPFLAINSDIWCEYPLVNLRSQQVSAAHLVLCKNPQHNLTGDFSFVDDKQAATNKLITFGNDFTFSGIAIYHPSIFARYSPGKRKLRDVFSELIERQQLSGELYSGSWLDVGTPERLQQANELARTDK